MGLPPLERPDLVHLITIMKTVGHENKFMIFSKKNCENRAFYNTFFRLFRSLHVLLLIHHDEQPYHRILHKIISFLVQTPIVYL